MKKKEKRKEKKNFFRWHYVTQKLYTVHTGSPNTEKKIISEVRKALDGTEKMWHQEVYKRQYGSRTIAPPVMRFASPL